MNVVKTRETSINKESMGAIADDLIFLRTVQLADHGTLTVRRVTQIVDEAGLLGGLYYAAFFVGLILYTIFVVPFRDLHLAESFREMKR